MNYRLSITIPVYNFAAFLSETLDTILDQDGAKDVEILIFDGGSTDHTPDLIAQYQKQHKNIRYVRRPQRGGIDRDMAFSVTESSGDYVWLFSGDDLFLPGSISKALALIDGGADLYLTRHYEWRDYEKDWIVWPTVETKDQTIFDLSNPVSRKEYFSKAQNTEAFFSFIGGLIVKKQTWESIPINEKFVGSCWAHAARLFELMPKGLTVCVLADAYLNRRPDNDSFGSGSIVSRYRLTIDGFTDIADHFFGENSPEAREVRRVLRAEYHPLAMQLGKFLCEIHPEREDRTLIDRLFRKLYNEANYACWRARFDYWRTTAQRFRRWQPELSAKYEARGGEAVKTPLQIPDLSKKAPPNKGGA